MSRQQQRQPIVDSRALIQRGKSEYLIVRMRDPSSPGWEFPGGRSEPKESPEATLRRHCRAQLGVELDIFIGQPPFEHTVDGQAIYYRYYMCGTRGAEAQPAGCADLRWVHRQQLRDYEFDAPTQQVIDWLLDEPDAQ